MKSLVHLLVFFTVSFAFGFYCTPSGFAQEKSASGKTTVTGCLQKGDEANEFSITGEFTAFKIPDSINNQYNAHYVDIDVYGTLNFTKNVGVQAGYRSLDLGYLIKHVGHKVTVTGTLKAESYEKEKGESEEHEKKEAVEAGDIRVVNLKMVSDSCK